MSVLQLFLALNLVQWLEADMNLFSKDSSNEEVEVAECAKYIHSRMGNLRTIIVHNSEYLHVQEELIKNTVGTLILLDLSTAYKIKWKYFNHKDFIIAIGSFSQLKKYVETFGEQVTLNRHLILCTQIVDAFEIKKLFMTSRYVHSLISVILLDILTKTYILSYNQQDFATVKEVSYNICQGNDSAIESIYSGKTSSDRYLMFCHTIIPFSGMKPYFKLLKYGIEDMIIDSVRTLGYHVEPVPHSYISLQEIRHYLKRFDGAYGGLFQAVDFNAVEHLTTYQDSDIFITRSPREIPIWKGLVLAFNKEVWFVLFIAIIGFILFNYFINKLISYNGLNIWEIYTIFVGQSARQHTFLALRSLFLSFTLFSLIITNAYTGNFLSFILKPRYEPKLTSVQDIVEKGLVLESYGGIYQEIDDPYYKKLLDNQQINNEVSIHVQIGNAVEIVSNLYFESTPYYRVPMQKVYHLRRYNFILINKGNAMVKIMKSVLGRLKAGGFLDKWLRDVQRPLPEEIDDFTQLSLDGLALIFCILIIGYILSLLVFFVELFRF